MGVIVIAAAGVGVNIGVVLRGRRRGRLVLRRHRQRATTSW